MIDTSLIPIESHPGFAKDPISSAIVNVNKSELIAHKEKKRTAKLLLSLQEEINSLKDELKRIKAHINLED
jgi:hypothetical protein